VESKLAIVNIEQMQGGTMKRQSECFLNSSGADRRTFLWAATGACAVPRLTLLSMQLAPDLSRSLTKAERDSMTPSQIIEELKKGNSRFRAAKMTPRDYLGEKRTSATGQYPAAVILGCIDSRVPAEIVFDVGIGDTFIGRVAGKVLSKVTVERPDYPG
jgi:carbonic anhydrase